MMYICLCEGLIVVLMSDVCLVSMQLGYHTTVIQTAAISLYVVVNPSYIQYNQKVHCDYSGLLGTSNLRGKKLLGLVVNAGWHTREG